MAVVGLRRALARAPARAVEGQEILVSAIAAPRRSA